MSRLAGKIAFITGAARGQGRAHAVTMAREGAHIVALDICHNLPYPRYDLATREDLAETVQLVEAAGGQCLPIEADVRCAGEMEAAVAQAIQQFGRIDVLICNAGITDMAQSWDITEEWWDIMVDVNLKGCWLTCKYVVPHMIAQGEGGRVILISSIAGLKGLSGLSHYCAAKWGVVGFAKSLALELAQHNITVNTLHPTNVDTPLISGMAHAASIPEDDFRAQIASNNLLDIGFIDPQDMANAAVFLASDEARYITGQELKVDAGMMLK